MQHFKKHAISGKLYLAMLTFMLVVAACSPQPKSPYPQVAAPIAHVEPHEIVSKHGHKRVDNYFWLKQREDTAVIHYLVAENKYLDTMMAHTRPLQEKLFAEMKGRIEEKDESVPYRLDHYFYYTRYEEGAEYPVFCRKKDSLESPEEIIGDGNALGKGHGFFSFYAGVNNDHSMAHLVMDTVGRRFYTIRIKDLKTGKILPDKMEGTTGNLAWTNDGKALLYSRQDPETLRSFRIFRHELGKDASKDELVYEEKDQTLACHVYKTRSKQFFVITSGRTDASYAHYLEADHGIGKLQVIEPLQKLVHYSVDHLNDHFYIRTNLHAINYRIVEAPSAKPGKENWKDLVPHRQDAFIETFEMFRNFLVVEEMKEGLAHIRLIKWADLASSEISFDEPAYVAGIGQNPDVNATTLRYDYQSMTTPASVYDFNFDSHDKKLMKQQKVLGGFDPANYQTERVMVTSRDSVQVPMSIVYRKGFKMDGTNPGLQYAYGSYGSSTSPTFSSSRLSLLDRGFVYAIAHVRGGQEMGGAWYENGKMLHKKNTFNDFVDCSKYLLDHHYVAKGKLFARGGSAGGLLMGAVSNMNPELYNGIIAEVPFVDVMTTSMDETIPLTSGEWTEWGDPAVKEEYDYIMTYSPYDKVEKKDYPNMLVTTGLHDSQVQYWEPAKWVAKLRVFKTDPHALMLHTNMEAGHGGASGRFNSLKETALEFAFMLDLVGIHN